jgi:KTSC domain
VPKNRRLYGLPSNKYYEDTQERANRILNLAQGMADKLNLQTPVDKAFKVAVPSEGFKQLIANTTNPIRPRAKAIAYDFDKRSLYVVFRDGTWWEYRNCPVSHFDNLQNTDSTGKYLASSGLDTWPDMGAADPGDMSAERKERLVQASETSARLQQTLILEEGDIQRRQAGD